MKLRQKKMARAAWRSAAYPSLAALLASGILERWHRNYRGMR